MGPVLKSKMKSSHDRPSPLALGGKEGKDLWNDLGSGKGEMIWGRDSNGDSGRDIDVKSFRLSSNK